MEAPTESKISSNKSSIGDKIYIAVMFYFRILLGAWMIINGLNHWFPIFPQPFGGVPVSSQLLVTLYESGLFDIVKIVEIIGGGMLIANRFVPIALVMLLPISAVVYYNGPILNGRWVRIFYMGADCLYINIILMLGYLKHYLPMMKADAELGKISDLKELKSVFQSIIPSKK